MGDAWSLVLGVESDPDSRLLQYLSAVLDGFYRTWDCEVLAGALAELVSNAFQHAFPLGYDPPVRLHFHPSRRELEISYQGPDFDPTRHETNGEGGIERARVGLEIYQLRIDYLHRSGACTLVLAGFRGP